MNAAVLRRIARTLEGPVLFVGRIGAYAIVPLVLIVLLDVVTRKITPLKKLIATSDLNDWISSIILQDLEWHAHTVIFATAIAYAYLRNGHVRVDLVHATLKPRWQAAIESAGCIVLLLPFSVLMFKNAVDFAASAFRSGEQSASLMGVGNTWIIKSSLVICFLCLALTAVATAIRGLGVLVSNDANNPAHRDGALLVLSTGSSEKEPTK